MQEISHSRKAQRFLWRSERALPGHPVNVGSERRHCGAVAPKPTNLACVEIRIYFGLNRLKCISRFVAWEFVAEKWCNFRGRKKPKVTTLANGSHAFLHGDMGTFPVWELLVLEG